MFRYGPCGRDSTKGILDQTSDLINNGFRTQQFYLGGPSSWSPPQLCSDKTRDNLASLLVNSDANFYLHAPHTVNLARFDDNGRSIRIVSKLLSELRGLRAGVVVHIGKVGTLNDTVQKLDLLESVRSTKNHLLLENAAGQGTELGRTIDEMYQIFEKVESTKGLRICWDTQHSFGAGICDWKDQCATDIFDQIEEILPKRLKLIHLNDSAVEFNRRVDRHAPLKSGKIWSEDDTGLRNLLKEIKDRGYDAICETSDFEQDWNIIKELVKQV